MRPIRIMSLATVLLAAMAVTTPAMAYHHRHHHHRGGKCDGFQACRCGTTAARRHGLPYVYRGINLKQAAGWKQIGTPISTPIPGAVAYWRRGGPTGHVATIERPIDRCNAVVSDDRGTYQRNICGALLLSVHG